MELMLLSEDFEELYCLDVFESLIWIERYRDYGEFDLVVPPTSTILSVLENTKYIKLLGVVRDKETEMILEDIELESDPINGDRLILQGRSLESILTYRVIWENTIFNDIPIENAIKTLLNNSFFDPIDIDRKVLNFEMLNCNDPRVALLTISTHFQEVFVHDAISELCRSKGLGFYVVWNKDIEMFQFQIYMGLDRSYDQTGNSVVAFTSDLNNLLNARYMKTSRGEKNVCLVVLSEGAGEQTTIAVGYGLTGFDRREMVLKASLDMPLSEITQEEKETYLIGKGILELAKNGLIEDFDGEIDTTVYKYGTHFSLGDILSIADAYGHSTKNRVIEMVYSQNSEGIKNYPRFEKLIDEFPL